jgi:hypothetical protein
MSQSAKKKGKKRMATNLSHRPSKAELRLAEYRRQRASATHMVKGTTEERNEENERVLDSFRQERLAANALIADEC